MAGDCNSLAETHAWFDSRVAHHFLYIHLNIEQVVVCRRSDDPFSKMTNTMRSVELFKGDETGGDMGSKVQ